MTPTQKVDKLLKEGSVLVRGLRFVKYFRDSLYLLIEELRKYDNVDHRCICAVNNKSFEVELPKIPTMPEFARNYQQFFVRKGSIVNVSNDSIEKLEKDTMFHFCHN